MSIRDSQRLEHAIQTVRGQAQSAELTDETVARLAQLVTVWASGYLEAMCRETVLAYTSRRAQPTIVNFVAQNLKRFQNPKLGKILSLIEGLDGEAARKLEDYAEGRIKASVNSIVGRRNEIAHGRSSQISMGQIGSYFDDARKFARKMRRVLDGEE